MVWYIEWYDDDDDNNHNDNDNAIIATYDYVVQLVDPTYTWQDKK